MSSPGRADMVTRSFTADGSEAREEGVRGSSLSKPQLEETSVNVTVLNEDRILNSSTAETRNQRCNRHKQKQRDERGGRRRRELAPEADLPLPVQSRPHAGRNATILPLPSQQISTTDDPSPAGPLCSEGASPVPPRRVPSPGSVSGRLSAQLVDGRGNSRCLCPSPHPCRVTELGPPLFH